MTRPRPYSRARHAAAIALTLLAVTTAVATPAESVPAAPDTVARPDYSAAELYNRGNAYARANNPAMAVLDYLRAQLLAPDDPDIAANLRFVREHLHPAAAASPTAASPSAVLPRLDPTLVAWLGVAGLLLLIAAVWGPRLLPQQRLLRRAAAVTGILFVALTVADAVLVWPKLHEAIVMTDSAARASPVPMADTLFSLSAAETVRIMAQHDDFLLVRAADGRSGWVTRAAVAPVVPERRP